MRSGKDSPLFPVRGVVSKVCFSCRAWSDAPCAEEGFRFFYDFKGESIIDGAHTGFGTFFCVDTPTEAVVAVVGNDMGMVCVAYNITCFCKSESTYGVVSATDGGGS